MDLTSDARLFIQYVMFVSLYVMFSCKPSTPEERHTVDLPDSSAMMRVTKDVEQPAGSSGNPAADDLPFPSWLLSLEKAVDNRFAPQPAPESISLRKVERYSSDMSDFYENVTTKLNDGDVFSYNDCADNYEQMFLETRYGLNPYYVLSLKSDRGRDDFVILKMESFVEDNRHNFMFEVRRENSDDETIRKFSLVEIDTKDQFEAYWKERIHVFMLEDDTFDNTEADGALFSELYFAIVPDVDRSELPFPEFSADCAGQ